MEKPSRPLNIPAGRVAERLKALQNSTSKSPTRSISVSKQASSSTLDSSVPPGEKQVSTPTIGQKELQSETTAQHVQQLQDVAELSLVRVTSQHDRVSTGKDSGSQEIRERGRSLQRQSETTSPGSEKVDDLLENVRERLYSVQQIVRRERSGSSQVRDETLDELGTMLDTAIATTMTPLNTPNVQPHTSFPESRGSSSSPAKESWPSTQLSRSRSTKPERQSPVRWNSRPRTIRDSASNTTKTRLPTRVQSPEPTNTTSSTVFNHQSDAFRPRRVSESAVPFSPPRGFPLASPVRERALLWESISRAAISEESGNKNSRFVTRFHPVTPRSLSPDKSPIPTPLIPLALPRFVNAERKAQEETSVESAGIPVVKALSASPPKTTRSVSSQWPEKLQLVSSSSTTVQQSSSAANPAEHDEHHPKRQRSIVTSKIKDLLNSTGKKVSSNMQMDSMIKEDDYYRATQTHELGGSVDDLEGLDERYLPHVQVPPDEVKKLYSHDGTSSSKVVSRKPTFDRKSAVPIDQRASSPVKVDVPTTPSRGRPRGSHSPGGRPYSLDHHFALSPSRSHSRGSRGSLTFNIKARVSPGRGFGKKDDTELFVTANIESDDSDQGG